MRAFVEDVNVGLARAKIPIYGTADHSVFRIHRDVRFSPDKRPFRTYAAAYLSRDARRRTFGGLYLRIAPEPAESFLSVTFYLMGSAELRAWRHAIVDDRAGFTRLLAALRRHRLTLRDVEDDDALVRMPRGFESFRDDPLADHLRRRSFSIRRTLGTAETERASLVVTAVRFARDARPLLHYGWNVLATVPASTPSPRAETPGVAPFTSWVSTRRS